MKSIISLSFDDGRKDNYTLMYPIIKKYDIPVTINIATGYIEGVINPSDFDFPEPMSVSMLSQLFHDSNVEIAGHGYMHINEKEDIIQGIEALHKMFGVEALYKGENGFASPGPDLSMDYYHKIHNDLLEKGISYVRLSLRVTSHNLIRIFMRKLARIMHLPYAFKVAYKETLMTTVEDDVLYSIPILSSTTTEEIISLLKYAMKKKASCVLMFHSIVNDGEIRNNWDYSVDKFEKLCAFLANERRKDHLNVLTSMDLYHNLKNSNNK